MPNTQISDYNIYNNNNNNNNKQELETNIASQDYMLPNVEENIEYIPYENVRFLLDDKTRLSNDNIGKKLLVSMF